MCSRVCCVCALTMSIIMIAIVLGTSLPTYAGANQQAKSALGVKSVASSIIETKNTTAANAVDSLSALEDEISTSGSQPRPTYAARGPDIFKRTPAISSQNSEPSVDIDLFEIKTSDTNYRKNQMDRHSYSVSQQASEVKKTLNTTMTNSTSGSDETLETAHSYFKPRVSSRSDPDDYESVGGDDSDSVSMDHENYIDGASSNLRERKVVKELTKVLSKGISGATDNVRVETLENLKRRQKERKMIKDQRAKLFEDLLTTAINNHSEKLKKTKKHSGSNLKSSASNSLGPSLLSMAAHNSDLDPELATDAETVLSHLQSLATAIDGGASTYPSNAFSYGSSSVDSSSSSADSNESGDDIGTQSEASNDGSLSDSEVEEKPANGKRTTKKISSERPIVRQFKKIKNQISQRRKQLDHIKKLFNVELALNPKDGSLVGRPVSSGKKKHNSMADSSFGDPSDLSSDSDTVQQLGNKRSKAGGSQSAGLGQAYKARELLNYLRDNPEILASVMAELTVDADPTPKDRHYSSSVGTRDELKDESDFVSLTSQRFPADSSRQFNNQDEETPWHHTAPTSRRSPSSSLPSATNYDSQRVKLSRSRASNFGNHPSASTDVLPARSARPVEGLLLESLRERQLLNLARLDLVLAERQAAAPFNRSSTLWSNRMAASNSLGGLSSQRMDSRIDESEINNYRSSRNNYEDSNRPNSNSSGNKNYQSSGQDEEAHHFMVVPGNQTNFARTNSDTFQTLTGQSPSLRSQPARYHSKPQIIISPYNTTSLPQSSNVQSQSMQSQRLNQAIQQQQASGLMRFRDWRDVSQSEANSWHYDKTSSPAMNSSWPPYDLTTGSSSALSTETQFSPKTIAPYTINHLRLSPIGAPANTQQPLQLFPRLNNNFTSETMNRPGFLAVRPINPSGNTGANFDSMFMTRSTAIEPDASTVKLGADNEEKPSGGRQERNSNRAGDNAELDNGRAVDGDLKHLSRPQPNSESAGQVTISAPAKDYFSSYKHDMGPKQGLRRRPKGTTTSRPDEQSHKDYDDGPEEMDDAGAMWA